MTAETTASADTLFTAEELGIPIPRSSLGYELEENEFFLYACRQARQLHDNHRHLQGPHYKEISSVLSGVHQDLKRIHPELTPEHLMASDYQSAESKAQLSALIVADPRRGWEIGDLRGARTRRLRQLGAGWAESDDVNLPAGLLGEPKYSSQFDAMACFNACFRMVFQGVTGHLPLEGSVNRNMGARVASDEIFLNIFSTPQFRQTFPEKAVQVLTVSGAAIATVGSIALKMKAKRPDAEVFCIVGLESDSKRGQDVWHSAVLLEAEPDRVWVQDPKKHQKFTGISSVEFHERWAIAHNRAHVIIAA